MPTDVQQLYGDYWSALDEAIESRLSRSLAPCGPEMLFDSFASFQPQSSDHILDIGGRDAKHAIELARRFGCRVTMIDPVPVHIERARVAIAASEVAHLVAAQEGRVESLPFESATFNHIWCRDVLCHVDHWVSLRESARVLKHGGNMLVYQTFATDLLEPLERARLCNALALVSTSMEPANFEAAAEASGLVIMERQSIGSEWRECWIEQGNTATTDDLLTVSRLRRQWPSMVEEFGEAACEAILAGATWGLYQFLGKTEPMLYLLTRSNRLALTG